jgi:pilus assembly protein Flp/PilA
MAQSIDALGADVFGVLARTMPSRLVEVSRSGCLLESGHRVELGTVGELRLQVGDALLADDVRVTRCVLVEGSGSSYLVGAEFLQTRGPGPRSIRRAVTGILRGLVQPGKTSQAGMLPGLGRKTRGGAGAARTVPSRAVPSRAVSSSAVSSGAGSTGEGEGVMKDLLARFVREDEGQDLIEYGLLAGLITTVLVAAITTLGATILRYFTELNTALPGT